MRRAFGLALFLCLTAGAAFAEGGEGGGDSLQLWKWANFVLLAAGLVYLMVKMLPPLFAERSAAIAEDIAESTRIRQDAEKRAAEVEERLAALDAEIAGLRAESKKESEAEAERLRAHTAAEIVKIQAQCAREIGDAGKAARSDLKRYAAHLAIDMAEQKIRARMTPAAEDGLVLSFVRELE